MNAQPRRKRSVVGMIVGVCAAITVPLATTLGALGAALFVAARHSGPTATFGSIPTAEETITDAATTDRTAGADQAHQAPSHGRA